MKWICRFACTGVFILGSFTLMCVPAFSQNARGVFKLNHEVRWQNEVVPAGEYRYSVELRGSSQMLTLRDANGEGSAIMVLVNDADSTAPATAATGEKGRLILTSQSGRRYVSSMEVPSIGVTLHFSVPEEKDPREGSRNASGAAK